jgi:D-beta-D-heptose 7-phosphate kinase/D-beta-D-heptose 1-phosphate adenosyltransferase
MTTSPTRLKRIIRGFSGRRIGVAGDWMLDRYIWGAASRLSPEAPVPVVEFSHEESVLGGAGNVAANLCVLGAQVIPFGVVGEDEAAAEIRNRIREKKMSDKGIFTDSDRTTTLKTRVIAGHQQVVRVDRESRVPISAEWEEKLIRRIAGSLRGMAAFVLSDYDKGVVTEEFCNRVLGGCRKLGVPAFVKPKWSMLPKYPGATAVVLNRKEAGFLVTRSLENDTAVEEAGRALLAHFGCPMVIITRGEHGMSVFEHDRQRALHIAATSRDVPVGRLGHVPGRSSGREVFDVTGAGDTVLAVLALAMAAGAGVADAAALANVAAGVVVGKIGTATVTPAELLASLRGIR